MDLGFSGGASGSSTDPSFSETGPGATLVMVRLISVAFGKGQVVLQMPHRRPKADPFFFSQGARFPRGRRKRGYPEPTGFGGSVGAPCSLSLRHACETASATARWEGGGVGWVEAAFLLASR